MTYPHDVLKAAREAVAKCMDDRANNARGKECAELRKHLALCAQRYRSGEWDQSNGVQSACIAIMAERERVKNAQQEP